MISLTINGKPRTLESETPLPQLLRSLEVNVRLIAVAINGEVIPKKQYRGVILQDGDEVEIVRMVGGGARGVIEQASDAVCKVLCPDIGSAGTGFFVEKNIVVTCDHVVAHEIPTPQGLVGREFSSQIEIQTQQSSFSATIISSGSSTDPYFYDYAVLRAETENPTTLAIGGYEAIAAGDDLIILGFPLGSDHLVATRAMVAAKARIPSHQNRIVTLDVVELDGSVNVGSSGGPAIAADTGEVIGIVSVRYGDISSLIDSYRRRLGPSPPAWLTDLLDILEESNRFMNPGLGHAVSTRYVRAELQRLRLQ